MERIFGSCRYCISPRYICLHKEGKSGHIIHLRSLRRYKLNQDALQVLFLLENGLSLDETIDALVRDSPKRQNVGAKTRDFVQSLYDKGLIVEPPAIGVRSRLRERPGTGGITNVFLEITQRCNLRCAHCYLGETHPLLSELSVADICALADEAAKLGAWRFDITGGEPFLRDDLLDILEYIDESGYSTLLFTNATLIDVAKTYRLAQFENLSIITSLDSIEPDKHDSFRGVAGAWDDTINAIKMLRAAGVVVRINAMVGRWNIKEMPALARMVTKELGATLRVDTILPVGHGLASSAENVSLEEFAEIAAAIWPRNTEQHGMTADYSTDAYVIEGVSQNTVCGVGSTMLFVESGGTVSLCPTLSSRECDSFVLGHFPQQRGTDIWNGERRQRFENLICGKSEECTFRRQCRGGCRSRAYHLHGDLTALDELSCAVFSKVATAAEQMVY